MMNDDYYALLSIISAMTFLTTVKLTLTGRITVGADRRNSFFFHPVWLGTLAVMLPMVVGYYLKGKLSPWPPAAFTALQAEGGLWAGILAAISTATIDLWLLWTTATALLSFTEPLSSSYEPIPPSMNKYVYLVNIIAGAFVIYKAFAGLAARSAS